MILDCQFCFFFVLFMYILFFVFFFFSSRRRHTRSYGDWSSDVCSSDLSRATSSSNRYFGTIPKIACSCSVTRESRSCVNITQGMPGGSICLSEWHRV